MKHRSLLAGGAVYLVALAAVVAHTGALVTILALAPLPWIRFPNDQYSVGAAWLFGNVVPLTLSWVLATLLARFILGPPQTTASPSAPAPA